MCLPAQVLPDPCRTLQLAGKRIAQAALSVFICYLIYAFFDHGAGTPFQSGIAVIIFLQAEIKKAFRIVLNRLVGTPIEALPA